jgi:cysteine desulfurase/selenocysteine lyase
MNHNHSPYRSDFPVFHSLMNGKEFVYLDTASSAQKPKQVMARLTRAYTDHYANIHRGLYAFSQDMTSEFEATRQAISEYLALNNHDVIFTRNTTESINLLATSWGSTLTDGDEIILTEMEHHANIVPWQLLATQKNIKIKFIKLTESLELDLDHFKALLTTKTKLVSVVHISNALGVINDVQSIIRITRQFNPNIVTIIDASQSIVHKPITIELLNNPDFIVFTAHKAYGVNGLGFLIGRHDILNQMSPYQGGGDMIETVGFDHSTFKSSPAKFEAGTPAIAEVISFGASLEYLQNAFQNNAAEYEETLANYLYDGLQSIKGIKIFGAPKYRAGIVSFDLGGIHHSDVAMTLNQMGIAVRTGHHCCMPLMGVLGVNGTVRASLGLYSQISDIDALVVGLEKTQRLFR